MANVGTRISKVLQAADGGAAGLAAVLAQRSDATDIVLQQGPLVRTSGITPTSNFEWFVQYQSVSEANPNPAQSPSQKSCNLDFRAGMSAGLPDIFS